MSCVLSMTVVCLAILTVGCATTSPVRVPVAGDLVRVSSQHYDLEDAEATLVSFGDRQMVVTVEGVPRQLLLSEVEEVLLKTGQRGREKLGAWIGSGLGLTAAVITGLAYEEAPSGVIAGAIALPVGVLVGAAIGSEYRSDRWELVHPRPATDRPGSFERPVR